MTKEPAGSVSMMNDQAGIASGFAARMQPAYAPISANEAEIAARRSSSIGITRCYLRRQKAGHRTYYAWTDNVVAANVRRHIRDPMKPILQVFIAIRCLQAYLIQGVPGQLVKRAGWTQTGFLFTNMCKH